MNEYLYPIAVNYQRILEVNNGPARTDGVLYVFSVPRLSG